MRSLHKLGLNKENPFTFRPLKLEHAITMSYDYLSVRNNKDLPVATAEQLLELLVQDRF